MTEGYYTETYITEWKYNDNVVIRMCNDGTMCLLFEHLPVNNVDCKETRVKHNNELT